MNAQQRTAATASSSGRAPVAPRYHRRCTSIPSSSAPASTQLPDEASEQQQGAEWRRRTLLSDRERVSGLARQFSKFLPAGAAQQVEDFEAPPIRHTPLDGDAARAADDALDVRLVQWYPGHIARAERQLKEQVGKIWQPISILLDSVPAPVSDYLFTCPKIDIVGLLRGRCGPNVAWNCFSRGA